MKWFVTLFCGSIPVAARMLKVGDEINTQWGKGTITGGCVHVNLVGNHPNAAENDHHVTLELDKVSL